MSTTGKRTQRTTKGTKTISERRKPVPEHRPASQPLTVVNLIKNAIQSELLPTNTACALLDKDGELQGYRAEFSFHGNLRQYVRLQGQALGEKRRLSGLISFTSAGSDVDALALPTSQYARETWKQDGTKLLQIIEKALSDIKNQGTPGLLSHNTHVSVTVYDSHLLLKIRGARDTFPKIIEQVSWLVSVAGNTSISLLERYAKETNGGKTTRGYAQTLYTGLPNITSGPDGYFEVSFSPPRVESHENHGSVAKTGQCWKNMAGLSIIASGYAIRQRPREGSGLEASLSVLRELFKRGCPGKRVLPLDKPMVMIPTQVGKDHVAYQLRLIMAVGAQQLAQGNAIYWHFDPAKLCGSLGSCEQLENEIRVGPSTIDARSRHFVGWSSKVGFLAGTSKTNAIVFDSKLTKLEHYKLVLTSANLSFRLPQVLSLGLTFGTERMDHTASIETMYSDAGSALHTLRYRNFVLWDTNDHRGWLVDGPVAALQLLRSYIKDREPNFDFSKLKHINDETSSAAYDVLKDKDNMKLFVIPGSKDVKEKSEAGESSEDQSDARKDTLENVCFNVYKVLLELSKISITQLKNKTGNNIPDWFQTWVGRRWETTVKGWDFQRLYHCYEPQVYVKKFRTDPGWLGLANELDAAFLFGGSFGDIMRPHDGHCCPYFKTLPKGENYLAVSMATVQRCVNNEGAAAQADETVAKLARTIGWERDVNPFGHSHGQGEHIDRVDASCFPVQRLVRIRNNGNDRQKDKDLVKKSKGRLYSWKEVDDMNTAATDVNTETVNKPPKTGMVVFGKKPDETKLRQLARANSPAAVGSLSRTTAQQSEAGSTPRPHDSNSLRSNTSVADTRGARTSSNDPAQPLVAPAGKAPGVASIRSTHSNTQRKAPGAGSGGERTQQSTSQTSTTPAQRTPSISSVRSTASNTQPKAPNTAPGVGQLQTSSPQTSSNSTHKTASNASLRSTGSGTHPRPAVAGSGRPGESTAGSKAPTAARKPSSSSVRTTSSVDSKATGGSQPQIPVVQPATLSLKKTNTHSSDKTTSSRSSRGTQNSTAGSAAADNRQRQQRQDPLGAVTAGTGVTESHHPTSSGPAPA